LADLLWDERSQRQAMSNLRTVLTGLRQHLGPYVSISRETVALNPGANIWLDVAELTEKLALRQERGGLDSVETATRVEAAIGLYHGDFLEGFHLRGAFGFEEWLTVERENLHQQVLDALSGLVAYHLAQGSTKAGIVQARRLLQLDPLLEEAHQQLMRLLAYDGQRAAALAQYETCRQILAEEFGLEPAAETTSLFEQIQAGTLEPPPLVRVLSAGISPKLPAFLSAAPPRLSPPALFVARERQLAQLAEHLQAAVEGHGRVVFITGEAGRGKTALLTEFTQRALETYPELIVASGNCNAYSGLGDPYLPFRDVLGMLSGDVESRWASGVVSTEHAHRLWSLLPHTAQTLLDHGPNLIELFVSGRALLNRIAAVTTDGAGLLNRLKEWVEQDKASPGDLEQRQLFEQYSQLLHTLAARQPLLILLDDLQWADRASISLLFHLGRRLAGGRILIVGAYRSSEVTLEQAEQHPLEPVVNEFRRLYGDIEVDLSQLPPTENRAFVDALLDSEPNQLGEAFREKLFRQAKGHPLFTVELLREMQARADLIQDETGRWSEGPALDWAALPMRVEAVIEQRLGRLDERLRDILTVASVEGEIFTAQVVARLQNIGERQLLRQLSRELARRHRLVQERGEIIAGNRQLSQFQFRHVLFQQYLYDQLSRGERRLLHGEMATLLEELYQGHIDEIAVQLARHYVEAGQGEKAIPYLLQAGDQARLAYAHEAAIQHYRQAVIFLKEQGDAERTAATLMKLGLTCHNAFEFEQSRLAYEEAFALRQVAQPVAQPSTLHPFRVLWPDDPPTLDPAFTIDYSPIVGHLFSGLVATTPELDVVPDVAQRWEILDGGRKYIFYLRDDIRWSDGAPVTAHDFEYAWKRILAPRPATGSPAASLLYDIKEARAFHRGEAEPEAVGVRALDAVTLVIELEGPVGYFLNLLTYSITYPVPRHIVETYGEDWTAVGKIVTNGPFRVESWQRGERLVLTCNEMYHGRFRGNVEKVECLLLGGDIWSMADWDTRSLALYETGALDVMRIAEAVGLARQKYAQEHISFPMFWTIYVSFDLSQPPFDDLRVRRAFALAIDSARYQNEVTKGLFTPATGGFLPPAMPGYSAGIGLPYDPAQARRLMAEAGYPDGHHFPKVKALGGTRQEAEYVQAQWRENLGVEVEWDVLDIVTAHEMASREVPALFFVAWGANYPDPDSFLRVCFQQPYHNWRHEAYHRLVEKARQLTDQEQRLKLYRQADRILMEQIPLAPLFYGRLHFLVKPWVRNFRLAPTWEAFWKDVVIEAH
ncbi:MAG: ABC transporter substrate-binding protein, partial [Chloroflexota bacterium]